MKVRTVPQDTPIQIRSRGEDSSSDWEEQNPEKRAVMQVQRIVDFRKKGMVDCVGCC